MKRLGLLLPLLLAGCGGGACRSATAYLKLSLINGAAAATALDLELGIDSAAPSTRTITHPAGSSSGAVEIDFKGAYPSGKTLHLTVTAREGTHVLAAATTAVAAAAGCTSLSLTLDGAHPPALDASAASDGASDGAPAGSCGCSPGLPSGFTGFAELYLGPTAASVPACGGGRSLIDLGYADLDAPPATCQGCTCTPANPSNSCSGSFTIYSDTGCTTDAHTYAVTIPNETSANAGCVSITSQTIGSANATALSPLPNTCNMATSGSKTIMPATWDHHAAACTLPSSVSAACDGDGTCVAELDSGFTAECVYVAGLAACPAPFVNQHVVYQDMSIADTRDCNPCGCNSPATFACGLVVQFSASTANNCGGIPVYFQSGTQTCRNNSNGDTVTNPVSVNVFASANLVNQAKCSLTTGAAQPTGAATPAANSATTFCCL